MSEQPQTTAADDAVPHWDVADRLRKALRHSGLSVTQMADYLGVSAKSVSNWINGRVSPSMQTVRLWALRTGVSYNWLCHGNDDPRHGPGGRTAGRGHPRRWENSLCSSPRMLLTRAVA